MMIFNGRIEVHSTCVLWHFYLTSSLWLNVLDCSPQKLTIQKATILNFFITKFSHISIIIIFLIFLEVNKFLELKL